MKGQVSMSATNKLFGAQIQGDRNYQEDALRIEERDEGTLLVLCDGMGGHSGGDQASSLAISTFIDTFFESSGSIGARLKLGVEEANNKILQVGKENPELSKMGTTLVAVFIQGSEMQWVSVGDSPLWLIREDSIKRLNANHSLAAVFEEMVKTGHMSAEDAATDPKRHSLRSSLSGEEVKLIDLCEQPFELEQGDYLLLASDGLETLSHNQILDLRQASASSYCKALLAAVDQAGKEDQDNATVLCYSLVGLIGKPAKKPIFPVLGCVALVSLLALGFLWYNSSKDCGDCSESLIPEQVSEPVPQSDAGTTDEDNLIEEQLALDEPPSVAKPARSAAEDLKPNVEQDTPVPLPREDEAVEVINNDKPKAEASANGEDEG